MADKLADLRAFIDTARARTSAASSPIVSLDELRAARAATPARGPWELRALAGRVVELSGVGNVAWMSATVPLIVEAQDQGEPVAWIGPEASCFFPPDLDAAGVDLDALIVVRAADAVAAARAAEQLLRSTAFGLLILDLVPFARAAVLPSHVLGRLAKLALHHDAAIVTFTEKAERAPSLGSMVSLRAQALRVRGSGGVLQIKVQPIKDKQRGPDWRHEFDVVPLAGLK